MFAYNYNIGMLDVSGNFKLCNMSQASTCHSVAGQELKLFLLQPGILLGYKMTSFKVNCNNYSNFAINIYKLQLG